MVWLKVLEKYYLYYNHVVFIIFRLLTNLERKLILRFRSLNMYVYIAFTTSRKFCVALTEIYFTLA